MKTSSTRRSENNSNKRNVLVSKRRPVSARRNKGLGATQIPPVMARNPVSGISSRNLKPARKNRRRFDLTLNSPGAEMRLPAIPRIHIGWRLLSLLLFAIFTSGLYMMWNSNIFRVETAQVAGLRRINNEAINTVLGISGKPIFLLDANQMEKQIQDEFQEFSSASVEVALPNSVVITVTERVPVLVWIQDGRTNLVDENGATFPMRLENENLQLPVVEAKTSPPSPPEAIAGSEPGSGLDLTQLPVIDGSEILEINGSRPLLSAEMVKAILKMAEIAPPESLLAFTAEHGLAWQDKRGWSVYFGTPEDMEMKLKVYRTILDHLKSQDSRPEMISVEFLSAPYYRIAG